MANKLKLFIRNRERVLFDGVVDSITSYNKVGRFDVLPQHANFITLLNRQISYATPEGEEYLEVSNGIMKVKNDEVKVYLGIGY